MNFKTWLPTGMTQYHLKLGLRAKLALICIKSVSAAGWLAINKTAQHISFQPHHLTPFRTAD